MGKNDIVKNADEREPDLSVVVLCYASKKEIFVFVKNIQIVFKDNGISDYELILVANYQKGADDKTPKYAKQITEANMNISCVCRAKAGMMGWDMRSGLELAKGKYIAVIDGDGQMPIPDLVRVYAEIKSQGADLVKTYRLTRGDGLWRKTISGIYNLLFALLFPGLHSRDINSKPKIFTREFFKKLCLVSDDWFIDAEIMINARRLRARVKELPTVFIGLCGRRRSFVRWPAIFEFIRNLIRFRVKEFGYSNNKK